MIDNTCSKCRVSFKTGDVAYCKDCNDDMPLDCVVCGDEHPVSHDWVCNQCHEKSISDYKIDVEQLTTLVIAELTAQVRSKISTAVQNAVSNCVGTED